MIIVTEYSSSIKRLRDANAGRISDDNWTTFAHLSRVCATPLRAICFTRRMSQVRGRTQAPEAQELYRGSDKPGFQGAGSEVVVTFGKKERQAQRYLDRIAKGLEAKGMKLQTEVLFWPPAEAITSYAERNGADIIVMSSHGRSGPSRWAHGSVADKVLRISCVPVLMVRAPGCVSGI